MSPDRPQAAPDPRTTRSRLTNGRPFLFGDSRTREARRFRDLVRAFGDEYGGMDSLSPTGQQLIKNLAQISVQLELMQAQSAAGEIIDPIVFVHSVNAQRRTLRALDALKKTKRPGPSLEEHLAKHYGANRDGGAT